MIPLNTLPRCHTLLADPPWRFANRTGKIAPEHQRLQRYPTMALADIKALPISNITHDQAHLYLWVPNALLVEGLEVMAAWGFTYRRTLFWIKIRKDGGIDGRGCGFYFRNAREVLFFGSRGGLRTLQPGQRQTNVLAIAKQEHSRKPDEFYTLIEQRSPGPYLELFARHPWPGWIQWGNQLQVETPSVHTESKSALPRRRMRWRRHHSGAVPLSTDALVGTKSENASLDIAQSQPGRRHAHRSYA